MADHDITVYLDPLLGSTKSVKDKILAATQLAGSIQFLSNSAFDDFLAHVSLDYPRVSCNSSSPRYTRLIGGRFPHYIMPFPRPVEIS